MVEAEKPVYFAARRGGIAAGISFLTYFPVKEIEKLNPTGMAVTRVIE